MRRLWSWAWWLGVPRLPKGGWSAEWWATLERAEQRQGWDGVCWRWPFTRKSSR